jgi:hypothetical protein
MKKFTLFLLAVLILTPNIALAAENVTPTAAPSTNQVPESDEEIERVQRIKDIVASKVAELNLVEKRGIIATVTEVSSTEIKAIDYKDKSVTVDVDELTKFDFEDENFGISDLEVGEVYSFIGLYNRDSEKLLARFISQPDSIPNYVNGAISEINEDDFQITVVNADNKTFTIDIENSTDTMIIDSQGSLDKSGFSGLSVGQRVIAIGFITNGDEMTASRIIHFELIPPSVEVLANLESETTTATGSSNTLEILEVKEEE